MWVQEWPGQIVLAGSSTYWTEGVELAINTNTMQEFFDKVQVNASHLGSIITNHYISNCNELIMIDKFLYIILMK